MALVVQPSKAVVMRISMRRIAGMMAISLAGVSLAGEGTMPFTFLCQVRQPSPILTASTSPPSTASAAKLSAEEAASAARAWLDALKRRDTRALAEKTRFPFVYETTSRKKLCEGTAVDAKELAATVDCLARRDKLLLEQLAHVERLDVKVLEPARTPPSLAKLIGKPTGGDRLVGAFLNGDGITFEFVLVVVRGGSGFGVVKTFLVNAEVESG